MSNEIIERLEKLDAENELKQEICNYLIRLFKKDITATNELVQLAKLVLKD